MYDAALSRLPSLLKVGSTITVQVDSANTDTEYGGVRESHEYEPIGYYNNFASVELLEPTPGASAGSAVSAAVDMLPPMPARPY
jgi:hypothetical protein